MSGEPAVALADEERMRAEIYALLGQVLAAPPSAELLETIRGIEGDGTEIGKALSTLAATARRLGARQVAEEYQDLFIGLGRGEVVPYASFYLTGFLQGRPLANLRGDMARLGIARADQVAEPEDHIASLCEIMAGLITGGLTQRLAVAEQRRFFDAHLAPWAGRFLADLEAANSAVFYMPVAKIGRLFMDIESQAFALAA